MTKQDLESVKQEESQRVRQMMKFKHQPTEDRRAFMLRTGKKIQSCFRDFNIRRARERWAISYVKWAQWLARNPSSLSLKIMLHRSAQDNDAGA